MYVDIMTEKNCIQFRLLIGQFVHPVGGERMGQRGWMKGVIVLTVASFTLLEYMIIWCKIQVIINPLLDYFHYF